MRLPCRGGGTMMPTVATLVLLLLHCVHLGHADEEPAYEGPIVCKGTRPLFVETSSLDDASFQPKPYLEPYWEQFAEHVKGCHIIVGNLIIPHMRKVPFELSKITDAVREIVEVTGFIYIYDVEVDIDFENLVVIHGNELLTYPWATAPSEKNKDEKFALFFDRVTAEHVRFPKLKLIKNGKIGFKSTPHLCAFKEEWKSIDVIEWFEWSKTKPAYHDVVKIFQKVGKKEVDVFSKCSAAKPYTCTQCDMCFGKEEQYCQAVNRRLCNNCRRAFDVFTCAGERGQYMCCEGNCRGGCIVGHQDEDDLSTAQCVACNDNQYLVWENKDGSKRKCVDSCDGLIIEEAKICLKESSCPDYMFKHSYNKCSYQCPKGMEFDPIADKIAEQTSDAYKAYWDGKAVCKPCRMKFVNGDFADDCGIGCVLPHNSLSFFSILNIVPGYDDMKQWTHAAFRATINDPAKYKALKRCRHLYGTVKIDQYSVGFPKDKVRLSSDFFDMLTEATGLYGDIVVENTEGFWYVDMLRNLVVISKPRTSHRLVKYFTSVKVQYNSDLRTLDLQRLKKYDAKVSIISNPLYIPPRNPANASEPVFFPGEEINNNGQEQTRSQKPITYQTGCTDSGSRIKAYYYKRCVTCPSKEYRVAQYIDKWRQLFYTCMTASQCVTTKKAGSKLYYITKRYDEKVCIACNEECNYMCEDETPFTCFAKDDKKKLDCVNNMIDQFNLRVCAPKTCPAGFYKQDKRCIACHGSCRKCNGEGNGFVLNGNDKGCLGCGIIYPAVNAAGAFDKVKCMNVGYDYRVAPEDESSLHNGFRRVWDRATQYFPALGVTPKPPVRD
uniref:Recep_L_domain domain-containing protein n=1 Tax=Panagrellus redivivus TaxID=6233 RepID=A0A7E4ZRM5_PANRE